jgi:hypothetical protein
MTRIDKNLKVFVSSTSQDLLDYRVVAREVILEMGWYPVMMEHFDAMPYPTVEACYKKLKECDLMVLIVAFRRGWVPTPEQQGNGQDSVAALELTFARHHEIPVLVFMASEDTWPGNLWENDDPNARAWIYNFREHINLPAMFFNYELHADNESERFPTFRTSLRASLLRYRESYDEEAQKQVHPTESLGDCVFFCYAREDQEFTLKLARNLKDRGANIWIDQWNIEPGADWDREIDKAIDDCGKLLIILSPNSTESMEVRAELRTALDGNKEIVPVLYKECRIPRQLRVLQSIDFTRSDPDDDITLGKLLINLKNIVKK